MVQPPRPLMHALDQRAAERDVQLLNATTDGQHRHTPGDRGADQRQRGVIPLQVMILGRLAFTAGIVRRVHVARTAGHQQAMQMVQQAELHLPHGRDHDRQRPDTAQHRGGVASRRLMHRHVVDQLCAGGNANNQTHDAGSLTKASRERGEMTDRRFVQSRSCRQTDNTADAAPSINPDPRNASLRLCHDTVHPSVELPMPDGDEGCRDRTRQVKKTRG